MTNKNSHPNLNSRSIRILTYMMFLIFAMTTDAVGVIIPEIIETFDLSLTQASTFHYATMIAIALSGVGLGFLSDKFGRKSAILGGLALFAGACFLFPAGESFSYFLILIILMGSAIGIFKTAALGLIGDISKSNHEHTKTMNMAEGFFGIGAIIGPALVTYLIVSGTSWVYLYTAAGVGAVLLLIVAGLTRYPPIPAIEEGSKKQRTSWRTSLQLMKDPYALGFSAAIALYVVTEAGIYVWLPTLLMDYQGSLIWLATYALSIFFIFRAIGRFLGVWVLNHVRWQIAVAIFSGLIFLCYLFSTIFGISVGVVLLPLSGLFMSIIYPTLNSKGISCFEQGKHGAIAGVILFFTAVAAAIGPLLMGLIGDIFGHVEYGFTFAMVCAFGLFLLSIWNYVSDPTSARLQENLT